MLEVRITRSARKWKLSAGRIRSALPTAEFDHMDGDMAIYHGTDHSGLQLEMGLVADDKHPNQLACVHAMPLEWRQQ